MENNRTKNIVAGLFVATLAVGFFAVYIGSKLSEQPDVTPTDSSAQTPTSTPSITSAVTPTTGVRPTSVVPVVGEFTGQVEIDQLVTPVCVNDVSVRSTYAIEISNPTAEEVLVNVDNKFADDFDDSYLTLSTISFGGEYDSQNNTISWGGTTGILLRANASFTLEFETNVLAADFGIYSNVITVFEFDKEEEGNIGQSTEGATINCASAPTPTTRPSPTPIPPTATPTPTLGPTLQNDLPSTAIISDTFDRVIIAFVLIILGLMLIATDIPQYAGNAFWGILTYEPDKSLAKQKEQNKIGKLRKNFEEKIKDKL